MIDSSGPNEPLPPLYAGWMTELFQGAIPKETRATCDDCAMCSRGDAQEDHQTAYFDPDIKCCTYVPDLHNFLVGRVLSDSDPAAGPGRKTVQKRIEQGIGVTPLGLGQPPLFSLLYENVRETEFGRSRALRCPHYIQDGGRCGVWRNRNSTCVTFFCKYVRGSIGYSFWRESLHPLLLEVERALARWALLELDIGDEALRRLVRAASWRGEAEPVTDEAIGNRVDREAYEAIWGKWLGREGEFYVQCARLINDLSWADVLAIGGPEVRAHARLAQDQYRRLTSGEMPSALKVGAFQVVHITRDSTRVSTYSSIDPIEIPNIAMESLHYFDGRPTHEAVAAIASEKSLRLEPAFVRKMADFAVLVPPE